MGYNGKHRVQKRKRHVFRAIAMSMAVVLVAIVGGGYLVIRHLEGNITGVDLNKYLSPDDRPTEAAASGPKKPMNILVLGSDIRAGQTGVAGNSSSARSDTTILLHLSADRTRAYGVSIPRDLMVPRPDCKTRDLKGTIPGATIDMWNAAYAYGGPACTIKQFEAMTHIRVNHFIEVNFNGFKDMVDALGGVPVCVPKEVNDTVHKIYLPAGSYDIKGIQALNYVRERYYLSNTGDIGRMKRQQAFLAAMTNKAVSAGTLVNPVRLYKFLDAATKSLTTDTGLKSISKLASLAEQLKGIGLSHVQFLTMPIGTYVPDPNRLAVGTDADKLWSEIYHDTKLSKEFTKGAARASQSGHKPKDAAAAEAAGLCA